MILALVIVVVALAVALVLIAWAWLRAAHAEWEMQEWEDEEYLAISRPTAEADEIRRELERKIAAALPAVARNELEAMVIEAREVRS